MKNIRRQSIERQLKGSNRYPILYLYGPMGYGKTTSVECFIKPRRYIKDIWIHVKEDMTQVDLEALLFHHLKESGIDETYEEMYETFDLRNMATWYRLKRNKTVYAIFDFCDQSMSEAFLNYVTSLSEANIADLRIIIICRDQPDSKMIELVNKGKALTIYPELFLYTHQEMEQLLKINHISYTKAMLEEMETYCQGWPLALSIIIERGEWISLSVKRDIEHLLIVMLEQFLDESGWIVLAKLSCLDSFTKDQGTYVSENQHCGFYIKQVKDNCCFVTCDKKGVYHFLEALNNVLHSVSYHRHIIEIEVWKRSARWHILHHQHIEAVGEYLKYHAYEEILQLMEQNENENYMDLDGDLMQYVFQEIDESLKHKYPFAYLRYINDYMFNVDKEKGHGLLMQFIDDMEKGNIKDENNQLHGEIEILKGMMEFNDVQRMNQHFCKAFHDFNGGVSHISNPGMIASFGSIQMLLLYHRSHGHLKELVSNLHQNLHTYIHITRGCNGGLDLLALSEQAYMSADFNQSELIAYQAYDKAMYYQQTSIGICTLYTLGRIAVWKNDINSFRIIINELDRYAKECSLKTIQDQIDCTKASLSILSDTDLYIAKWLHSGDLFHHHVLYEGEASIYIVYGEVLIYQHNYDKLKSLSEYLYVIAESKHQIIAYLQALRFEIIACMHHGEDVSKRFEKLIDLCEMDDIKTLIVDQGEDFSTLFQQLDLHTTFRKEVYDLYQEYRKKHLRYFDIPELSYREYDVMSLIMRGCIRKEIASKLHISENTVRFHIKNIYAKLNVKTRQEAIRIYQILLKDEGIMM